ncbi:hypothetical protein ACHQM5_024888 [Ranunculus cassubicifolius]
MGRKPTGKGKAVVQATKEPKTTTRGKGKAAVKATNKRNTTTRGKAACCAARATKKPKTTTGGKAASMQGLILARRHDEPEPLQPIPERLTFANLYGPGSGYEEVPGSESSFKDYVEPDRKTLIARALTERQNQKVESEEVCQRLNAFLERNQLSADNPYKYAMQKLLHEEASTIDREVREEIFKYIQETLIGLKSFFVCLLRLKEGYWDVEVAGYIVEAIQEVTDQLEVEVTELKDIADIAKSIITEPVRRFPLAKGEYLKDNVRYWHFNTDEFEEIAKVWVDNPTASFSTIDTEASG